MFLTPDDSLNQRVLQTCRSPIRRSTRDYNHEQDEVSTARDWLNRRDDGHIRNRSSHYRDQQGC